MPLFFDALRHTGLYSPALYYGLAVLLGISTAFHGLLALLVPISLLAFISSWDLKKLFLSFGLFLASFFYALFAFQIPQLEPEGALGTAHLEISALSAKTSHIGKQWLYKGTIRSFIVEEKNVAKNILFTLSLPKKQDILRPLANQSYIIRAKLKKSDYGDYYLVIDKNEPWHPVKYSWSLAEFRYQAKQAVSRYIHSHIHNQRSATFLTGIATGNFDDRLMSFEFARFGLQHVMAISGFHFAILATILSFFLQLIVPQRIATLLLVFLLSSYFVFLGCGPSIMRAWVGCMIVLVGWLMQKQGNGLNSLGVGLILILFWDPLICTHLGFQLSFLTSAAILIFFPIMDYFLKQFFLSRSLGTMILENHFTQTGYLLLIFFRKAIALTLAVNLITLPMTLLFFQQFPLLSLLYNVFFPFMVSISILLLILGLHSLNNWYTEFMLNFTYNLPPIFDVKIHYHNLSHEVIMVYLCLLFLVGIVCKHYLERKNELQQDLVFI